MTSLPGASRVIRSASSREPSFSRRRQEVLPPPRKASTTFAAISRFCFGRRRNRQSRGQRETDPNGGPDRRRHEKTREPENRDEGLLDQGAGAASRARAA